MHIIPGRVSTEVDARFSFDIQANIKKALGIIALYEEQGISKDRVLIKLASTWEGIQAAKILQKDYGMDCNMTLVFSLTQAIAAAEAGAFVTSPFVGRILDWHKATEKKDYTKEEDPGVLNVKTIFNYYKRYGYRTRIMGASFRNVGEVTELAGCDYLTISPSILEQLYQSTDPVVKKLDAAKTFELNIQQKTYLDDESLFRFDFNENRMAVEKLREGISKFARDASILKDMLRKRIEAL